MARLCIEKSGMVHSGYIEYEINEISGEVFYEAKVKIKKGWLSKTIRKSGIYKLEADKLNSTNFDEKDESMDLGHGTHVRVIIANHGISLVSVISKQYNGTGEVELDISKSIISVRRLKVNVKYLGMSLTVKAHAC